MTEEEKLRYHKIGAAFRQHPSTCGPRDVEFLLGVVGRDLDLIKDWFPVHRNTLAMLHDRSLILDALGKFSPNKLGQLGFSEDEKHVIEDLYAFFEGAYYYAVIRQEQGESADVAALRQWITDLQSQMYVNCVYCGHRYGPGETTPVSMADVLKSHVEQCPKHPMSALREENKRIRQLFEDAVGAYQGSEFAAIKKLQGDNATLRREISSLRRRIKQLKK